MYRKRTLNAEFPQRHAVAALVFFLLAALAIVSPASAASQIDDISGNIAESTSLLPGLISAFSYLLALIFAITGILKLREHVENPQQVPIRVPIIRFLVGGGLLALPIIYEAMAVTFNGGVNPNFDPAATVGTAISQLFGSFAAIIPLNNINNVFETIIDSIEDLPGVITAVAYVLGLVAGVGGLLKLKEHVENPEQVPLREAVIRFLVGGALFALPIVYEAMFNLIGDAGILASITSILGPMGMVYSSYGVGVASSSPAVFGPLCNPAAGLLGGTIGGALCGIFFHAGAAPAFLTAISYVIGLFLGVWGIFKIRAHVLNPQQTSLWEGISRLAAGGAFFALPVVIEVIKNTIAPIWATGVAAAIQISPLGFNETGGVGACNGTGGLDVAMYCLMGDTMVPMHVVINFFATIAGMILAMIGISRLMKSAQDGPRAPGGLGTIMTFAAAGALLSYNALMRIFTVSISAAMPFTGLTSTFAQMRYVDGMSADEQMHAHTVISAILKFMIIVGLISFVRGIFIIRSVAEGNGQASIMAGVTHMLGGALAVNLGAVINFVQNTLGITTYGISFA